MKHIIDIDEEMYKQVITNDTVYVLDDIDFIMLENAIAEGKPLQEEFEEIKKQLYDINDTNGSWIKIYIPRVDVIQILDNYIKETK